MEVDDDFDVAFLAPGQHVVEFEQLGIEPGVVGFERGVIGGGLHQLPADEIGVPLVGEFGQVGLPEGVGDHGAAQAGFGMSGVDGFGWRGGGDLGVDGGEEGQDQDKSDNRMNRHIELFLV